MIINDYNKHYIKEFIINISIIKIIGIVLLNIIYIKLMN
jgi:hypothetical protein